MDSVQRKQIGIDPSYLIQISHSIQILSHFYEQESLGNLSAEYRNLLTSSFTTLNQTLQIYTNTTNTADSSIMVNSALIKCKSQIEIYCMEKLAYLLKKETELGDIVYQITKLWKQNIEDFQKLLLEERRRRIDSIEGEKDKIIAKLKEELLFRKEYIAELKQRLEDVEQENSKMRQKMIGNAKSAADRALSPSPKKLNNSSLNQSLGNTKLKAEALLGTAHKKLSAKQVEETILDIMETKQRQETVKGKKVSLKNFLKTYFRFKFGMKDLADETQLNFRQAVEFFSQSQEKNIYILFMKMFNEECQEQYFWEQRNFNDKLIRIIKRYLNQKENIPVDELERIYDNKIMDERSDILLNSKDVQYILINVYKTSEVDSLQMILNQILIPKLQKGAGDDHSFYKQELTVPSKMLINEILNYQLSRHTLKIEDVIRVIRDVDKERGYLNQEELETVITRLKIEQQKIEACYDILMGYEGKFVTYSEAIQVIQKIRKVKTRRISDRTR